ncbi:hydantoinase/oxoprolinase family protein [uncultured Veillonella sp.]|uniref:hydantoinase/oxoprolinase family protein n=1 Tax=uncultured Veillonella sp. TaxID=159268 RepID=UPI0025D5C5FC|nr:hydantoinase/oxoprolinase family protein [uncultured Veillonella sp.]MDY3973068.1 hydantoinase/oxoprolinase family protein [Veillonella caviae]
MLIGLDVGGTFTDAVVVEQGRLLGSHKCRTTHDDLLQGITEALAGIKSVVIPEKVERITLSTTIITNTLINKKEDIVDLYIIPGPGMDIRPILPVEPIILRGYTDHRGALVRTIGERDLKLALEHKKAQCAAVSGKFSVRNPKLEQGVAAYLRGVEYDLVTEGARLSGTLNFPRRTISAYFNSAVSSVFAGFSKAVSEAVVAYHKDAPIYILKADGGALPLHTMEERPVETVFTGPAASVLGIGALHEMPEAMTVALDMGGTTTDISLWRGNTPLMARGGATIREYPSAVRSFAVKSVGIGGETLVHIEQGELQVGPMRIGPSLALGGKAPTLGDALLVLGKANYGDVAKAKAGYEALGKELGETPHAVAEQVVRQAIDIIDRGIAEAVEEENRLPVYVVADIVNPNQFVPEHIVGVGGTATALAPLVGEAMNLPVTIPDAGAVANAIGAALAKETLEITVHLDTAQNTLVVPELGLHSKGDGMRNLEDVKSLAAQLIAQEATSLGLANPDSCEIIYSEDVPIIEGWQSMHRLITVRAQRPAGVKYHVK